MKYFIGLFLIGSLFASSMGGAYAQQPQLATYHEIAQVLVDEKIQNKTTAFITLTTNSPLEMRVPTLLDQKINNAANVTSVAITNADPCVLGVVGQTCVVITIYSPSLIESYNIATIQNTSRTIGDSIIGDINKAFSLDATFWSTYVQPKGEFSTALGTSGALVGNRTINVVYTTTQQKSSYLLDALSTVLLPKEIRDAGGFYDVATKMAQQPNSTVTFAITPTTSGRSIYQLQVSKQFPLTAGQSTTINPLDLYGVDRLDRSSYFNGGFFPLNSIFEVSAISDNYITIKNNGGNLVPTTYNNGQKIPSDITKSGWIFDPDTGQRVTGIYLFGTTTNATGDQLTFTLANASGQFAQNQNPQAPSTPSPPSTDYSIFVIIGIIAAGAGAVYLFMKKR
jgi:hypothetical protein